MRGKIYSFVGVYSQVLVHSEHFLTRDFMNHLVATLHVFIVLTYLLCMRNAGREPHEVCYPGLT
jgi:hypothetical protein